jgi:hypothetical protein
MKARRAKQSALEPTVTEICLKPPVPVVREKGRGDIPDKQVDSLKEQERRAMRRFILELKRNQSERLNPYWLEQHAAIPAFLLFAGVVLFFLTLRTRLEIEFTLWFLVAPVVMVLIAFILMVVLHNIELRRRI